MKGWFKKKLFCHSCSCCYFVLFLVKYDVRSYFGLTLRLRYWLCSAPSFLTHPLLCSRWQEHWAWREFGDGLGLLGYQKGRKLTRKDLPADHKRIEISHIPSYVVSSQQREWHLVRLLPRKLVRTTLSWVILEEECNEEEAPETCPKAILVALTRRVPSLAGNIPGKQHPWTHGWFSMNSIRP